MNLNNLKITLVDKLGEKFEELSSSYYDKAEELDKNSNPDFNALIIPGPSNIDLDSYEYEIENLMTEDAFVATLSNPEDETKSYLRDRKITPYVLGNVKGSEEILNFVKENNHYGFRNSNRTLLTKDNHNMREITSNHSGKISILSMDESKLYNNVKISDIQGNELNDPLAIYLRDTGLFVYQNPKESKLNKDLDPFVKNSMSKLRNAGNTLFQYNTLAYLKPRVSIVESIEKCFEKENEVLINLDHLKIYSKLI